MLLNSAEIQESLCIMCMGKSDRLLLQLMFCGHRDTLLPCQVEQLKEELSHSQSEKEELRERASEIQLEVSAVRDAALCPFTLLLFISDFLDLFLSTRLTG